MRVGRATEIQFIQIASYLCLDLLASSKQISPISKVRSPRRGQSAFHPLGHCRTNQKINYTEGAARITNLGAELATLLVAAGFPQRKDRTADRKLAPGEILVVNVVDQHAVCCQPIHCPVHVPFWGFFAEKDSIL